MPLSRATFFPQFCLSISLLHPTVKEWARNGIGAQLLATVNSPHRGYKKVSWIFLKKHWRPSCRQMTEHHTKCGSIPTSKGTLNLFQQVSSMQYTFLTFWKGSKELLSWKWGIFIGKATMSLLKNEINLHYFSVIAYWNQPTLAECLNCSQK